ncbi:MAG: ATP-binding protein [Thermoplasmatales archaeon]|nr:ATP-binding protein [Thermoplasmatales archaeon]
MDFVTRGTYIEKIRPFVGTDLVKVLVGIRRCGKSTLMSNLATLLSDEGSNVVYINMEEWGNRALSDPEKLLAYVEEGFKGAVCNVLMVDEIQGVREWESVVRSLVATKSCDIYITGSNSKMLSSEYATYLTGRTISFDIYPLTFRECVDFDKHYGRENESEKTFQRFLRIGGFPSLWRWGFDEGDSYMAAKDIINAVVQNDIMPRFEVRNPDLLRKILHFIADNLGNPTSINRIFNMIRLENPGVAKDAVYSYFSHLVESRLIIKVDGADLKGHGILRSKSKYYLADHGLRNSLLGYDAGALPGIMENIILVELLSRGYKVSVGDISGREVDFVADKPGGRIYVQATIGITSEEVFEREFGNLAMIKDNHPKYVVMLNPGAYSSYKGIIGISLIEFLKSDAY